MLRELLTDDPESVRWPESLRAAVRTRGFAAEVQAVLARAREKGLDPADLARARTAPRASTSSSPPAASCSTTSWSSTTRARSTTPT